MEFKEHYLTKMCKEYTEFKGEKDGEEWVQYEGTDEDRKEAFKLLKEVEALVFEAAEKQGDIEGQSFTFREVRGSLLIAMKFDPEGYLDKIAKVASKYPKFKTTREESTEYHNANVVITGDGIHLGYNDRAINAAGKLSLFPPPGPYKKPVRKKV